MMCDRYEWEERGTFFFFNDTATTEIYTLSLHDALPISAVRPSGHRPARGADGDPRRGRWRRRPRAGGGRPARPGRARAHRSEEHTSELQSRQYLVCRLLLEKKKTQPTFCLVRTANSATN